MMKISKIAGLTFFLLVSMQAMAQDTLSVLFLGNSYTSVNNLPQLVKNMAASAGKTLITDSNLPGGQTISGHLMDANSMAKIRQGGWDYVVIQEQSQVPSIDFYRYNDMYPALYELKDSITARNPCAKIITYMTWGRRFGGQQCDPQGIHCSPVFTNFNHMQDSLTSAYLMISNLLKMQCAPVGVAWKNVLNDTNLVLHSGDNSHPALSGSYLAACVLHSSIWKKPVTGLAYNAGLSAPLATYLQQMSDQTVFPSAGQWNLHINKPQAAFSRSISGLTVSFSNQSQSLTNGNLSWFWEFGDGSTSTAQNPQHTYTANGTYTVRLRAMNCIFSDTVQQTVQLGVTENNTIRNQTRKLYPIPAADYLQVEFGGKRPSGYTLYNHLGQYLRSEKFSEETGRINTSALPDGWYFLLLSGDGFSERHSVIIKR